MILGHHSSFYYTYYALGLVLSAPIMPDLGKVRGHLAILFGQLHILMHELPEQKSLAYDVEPEHPSILKADFLATWIAGDSSAVFFRNLPFGGHCRQPPVGLHPLIEAFLLGIILVAARLHSM
jgi:hypothetical protein